LVPPSSQLGGGCGATSRWFADFGGAAAAAPGIGGAGGDEAIVFPVLSSHDS
jgi:hypothetical protein